MNEILKAGIIGYGYMGEIRERMINQIPELELIGIYDTDTRVRDKIKKEYLLDSFERLLEDDVDIIFVCTPNVFSPKLCIESMKKGKHVFCEKPPGRHIQDIEDVINAEKGDVKLMFGFNHRFHPGVIKAKVMIDSGRLGKIVSMRGVYGKSGGMNFKESWRNDKNVSGGGILLDQGIHMLDLFLYLCGDFDKVKCFTANSFWNFTVEDNACVMMKNSSGQTAMLHSSATLWKHTFKLDIILENGYLIVEGLLSKSGSYGREKLILGKRQFENETDAVGNPSEEVTYFDRDESWELEVKEFVKCIKEKQDVTVSSSQDAYKVMKVIERAYNDAGDASLQEVIQ